MQPSKTTVTGLIGALLLMLALPLAAVVAQDDGNTLRIGGIEHTVVDGQHVIIAALENPTPDEIEGTGSLSIVDAAGNQVMQVDVSTGPLVPDGGSVMAIPLPEPLDDGRYSLTLILSVDPDDPPVSYGLRQFSVGLDDGDAAGDVLLPESGGNGGFPSWIVLLGGLMLVTIGFIIRRGADDPAPTRPVPQVSMIRKVKLNRKPARKPAVIKPLRPPGKGKLQ